MQATATAAVAGRKQATADIFTITRRSSIAAMPDVTEVRITSPGDLLDLAPTPQPVFLPGASIPAPARTLTLAEVKAKRRARRVERALWVTAGACGLAVLLGFAKLVGWL